MDALTHLEIANVISYRLKKEFSIKLHKAGFFYGMIKPDISRQLKELRHYKDHSLDFVEREIGYLLNMRTEGSLVYNREFSERLGVVAHLIADYFCFPHTRRYRGGLLIHILYEVRLAFYCQFNTHLLRKQTDHEECRAMKNFQDIENRLNRLQDEYFTAKSSQKHDLTFAVKACTDICLSIIFAGCWQQVGAAA